MSMYVASWKGSVEAEGVSATSTSDRLERD